MEESKVNKYLQLEKELQIYKDMLAQAAETVKSENVSNYPIFVVHQHQVDVGIPIADKEKTKGNWSINVSSLEEFVSKKMMEMEKVDDFIKLYKDNNEKLCLFVLSELGAEFVFIKKI